MHVPLFNASSSTSVQSECLCSKRVTCLSALSQERVRSLSCLLQQLLMPVSVHSHCACVRSVLYSINVLQVMQSLLNKNLARWRTQSLLCASSNLRCFASSPVLLDFLMLLQHRAMSAALLIPLFSWSFCYCCCTDLGVQQSIHAVHPAQRVRATSVAWGTLYIW